MKGLVIKKMATVSDRGWIMSDFSNTLLLFILVFLIYSKSATKFNLSVSLIVISLCTYADVHLFAGVSELMAIPLYFFVVRTEKTGIVEKILVMVSTLFVTLVTQNIGAYIVYGVLNFTEHAHELVALELSAIIIIVNYALSLLVYYLGKKLIKRFQLEYILRDSAVESIILIALIILTASNIILNLVGKYLKIQTIYLNIILLTTIVVLIFISIGMIVFIVGHLARVKADSEMQQINERNAYINGLEEKNNELRRFKHDYKNFLLSLSASIENNQDDSEIVQRLLNYADVNLKNDTKPSDANLYKINDKLIRGIIITKIMIARDKGIQTNVEIAENVEIPQKSSIDITRILGILFDNAIEASLKNPQPELDFALISYDKSVEFVFKNNVDPTATIEMSKLYELGYSTKSNHNGLGLATVKKIVNANKNFLLQTKFKNSKFSTVLTSMKK